MGKINAFISVAILYLFLITGMAAGEVTAPYPVKEFTLENGLTFLVVERHTAPVFSGAIVVGVGSASEKIGNIGTAHLLEHMMFKGSANVGTTNFEAEKDIWIKEDSVWNRIAQSKQQTRNIKINEPEKYDQHLKYIESLELVLDSLSARSSEYVITNEFDLIYTRNGGAEFNALTSYDKTLYFVSLPANRLELWFKMESDRLKSPAMREFFTERDVVSEERRMSVENNAEAKLFEQLIGTAFIAHPYQIFWEWQSEIHSLTRQDLMEFFSTYYVPGNMAIAITGDVTVNQVKEMAEKYFADIPSGKVPEPIYTVEPKQEGERRIDLHYDANPMVYISYHKTAFDAPDEPAFKVIERLLGEGRTSMLYKTLVLDKKLCLDVSVDVFPGGSLGDLAPGVLNIYAYPKDGIKSADVEKAVYEELEKLATNPVDELELTKIKNNIESDYIWAAYSNIGLAVRLAAAQNLAKDWRFLSRHRESLKEVTADDIMRVAGQYFTDRNRTVATLIPIEKGANQ
jgi:predicted Zn-dependent peptidase